jgi:transposase
LLGSPADLLVAMEATGHYSRNLFGALGYAVALINPLRTRRFAEEDVMRAKTDSVDAMAIARFAAQKRPAPTEVDRALDQLRELVCFYNRILQDYNARLRQLYRLVNLCFPEFLGLVRTLDSQRAATLLREYPTSNAFAEASIHTLAGLRLDGRRRVGVKLAHTLIEAARLSVGRHDEPRLPYRGPAHLQGPGRSARASQGRWDGDRGVRRRAPGLVTAPDNRRHQRHHHGSNPRGCR